MLPRQLHPIIRIICAISSLACPFGLPAADYWQGSNVIAILAPEPIPLPTQVPTIATPTVKASAENNAVVIVEEMLRAVRRNAVASAYGDYMSVGFRQINNLQTFQKFISTYPILKTAEPRITVYGDTPEGYASIGAEFPGNEGSTNLNVLLVVEGGGRWKILALDIATPQQSHPNGSMSMGSTSMTAQPAASTEASTAPISEAVTAEEENNAIILAAQRLLASLRQSDFSAAYKYYMSDAFQKNTTYEAFKKTVSQLPVITQGNAAFATPNLLDSSHSTLVGKLTSPYGNAELNFVMVKTTEGWKINSLEIAGASTPMEAPAESPVIEPSRPQSLEDLDSSSPNYPIEAQLFMLSKGDINRSYLDLMAREFQRTTTMDEYTNFIHSYDILSHNVDYTVTPEYVKSNEASFKVVLTSEKGTKLSLTYDLTLERGGWKILNVDVSSYSSPPRGLSTKHPQTFAPTWGNSDSSGNSGSRHDSGASFGASPTSLMRLAFHPAVGSQETMTPPPESPPPPSVQEETASHPTFTYGAFGTTVDTTTGLIKDPTLTLPKGKENIYFNLYVENGKAGQRITVDFRYLKTGISIPQITSTINTEGSSTLSYIFSPPPTGWLEGIYEVKASYNNEETKTFSFRVQ